jgi:hypothetical protein
MKSETTTIRWYLLLVGSCHLQLSEVEYSSDNKDIVSWNNLVIPYLVAKV